MNLNAVHPGLRADTGGSVDTGLLTLDERLRAEMACHSSAEGPPTPSPEMEAMVKRWAQDQFIEKIMYGEEEETGIPPLSIDI